MSKTDDTRKELLTKAFGGSVEGWEYTHMTDAGPGITMMLNPPKCPCGHPIRYICHWEHKDGRKTHTGNVCVNTVPELGSIVIDKMAEDLKKIQNAEKEAKKAAKINSQIIEINKRRIDINRIIDDMFGINIDTYNQTRYKRMSWDEYAKIEKWEYAKKMLSKAMKMKSFHGKMRDMDSLQKWVEAIAPKYNVK